jgi:H+/Cl- antiporter ClcA
VATVLALLGFALYIVLIVGLAAGITWVVVRLTPAQKKPGADQARS